MSVDLSTFLAISAGLFAIGGFGLVAKRSLSAVLMSTGLMFAAAVVALAAFSRFDLAPHHRVGGQAFAALVAVTAASEVVVGLGMVRLLRRQHAGSSVDDLSAT